MAGIESSAKIRSVKAIATKTIVKGEAPFFLNQVINFPSFHSFSPDSLIS
jgi:hypothetical protein